MRWVGRSTRIYEYASNELAKDVNGLTRSRGIWTHTFDLLNLHPPLLSACMCLSSCMCRDVLLYLCAITSTAKLCFLVVVIANTSCNAKSATLGLKHALRATASSLVIML